MLVNTRMYSVTPAAKAAWHEVFSWVLARARVEGRFVDHDPPALLSDLWSRDDLGCVMMCGLPYALRTPHPTVLASPVPAPARYGGRAIYMSDLAVRRDSPYQTLQDTYGQVAGYTLPDSQSGYFAFRYQLLRQNAPPRAYKKIVGNLMNARGVIRALAAREIDIGPLDGYVFDLIRAGDAEFAGQVRIVASTDPTPMPPIVATAALPDAAVQALRSAFLAVADEPALTGARAALLLDRFIVPDPSVYQVQRSRAAEVEASGEEWP